MKHFYIVPAWSDQAGQCRIVSTDTQGRIDAGRHYEQHPERWREVGLMSSQGKLRCLTADRTIYDDIKSQEPLMAGVCLSYEVAP